jgi:uncharacterized protein with NAD-binding domain and iron-sulfur cluster
MASSIQATTTETTQSTQPTALDKKKNTDTTNTSPVAPVPSLISKKNTKITKTKYSTPSNVRKPSKEDELLRAKHAMQNLGLAPKWKITEATNKTEEKTSEEILIKKAENIEIKNEEIDEDAQKMQESSKYLPANSSTKTPSQKPPISPTHRAYYPSI